MMTLVIECLLILLIVNIILLIINIYKLIKANEQIFKRAYTMWTVLTIVFISIIVIILYNFIFL
ncbi:ABC-type protease/lipase transport system fused ATPase/permease subunit [Staphylococcus warneri]